jgi:hypothetical protein
MLQRDFALPSLPRVHGAHRLPCAHGLDLPVSHSTVPVSNPSLVTKLALIVIEFICLLGLT